MPRIDGYSLAHTLHKNPRTMSIPIIFISATYVTPEDRRFALNLGAVRFLEKPIDREEFLLSVGEILTQGVPAIPRPMDEQAFYQGYRERIEAKLRHKSTQIARIERLLQTLQPDQQPAFQALLNSAICERDEIQGELDILLKLVDQTDGKVN